MPNNPFFTTNPPAGRELPMTIDKSLKVRRGATSTRNVLSRAERLERLKENDLSLIHI